MALVLDESIEELSDVLKRSWFLNGKRHANQYEEHGQYEKDQQFHRDHVRDWSGFVFGMNANCDEQCGDGPGKELVQECGKR